MIGHVEFHKLPLRGLVIVLTCALCPDAIATEFHPLHVSVTEIEYDQKENELEIMIRIFVDDLEKAIRQQRQDENIDILRPNNAITTEKLISAYLADHFAIALDNEKQNIRYLGQEEEGQALICYVLVSDVKAWNSCKVTNTSLLELYDDQSNIVHVTARGKIKSLRLVKDNPQGLFSFDD